MCENEKCVCIWDAVFAFFRWVRYCSEIPEDCEGIGVKLVEMFSFQEFSLLVATPTKYC